MRVAFIPNYERTVCFREIARRLELRGHEVYWLSPSHHWASWLRGSGVPDARLLDLTVDGPSWRGRAARSEELARLSELETSAGVRINDLILMDRILRARPREQVAAYFAVISRAIGEFLSSRGIERVFAEQTFGMELLTSLVCTQRGVELLAPASVRVPSEHLGFFRGHLQRELVALRAPDAADAAWAAEFLREFRSRRPRPDYFHLNNRQPVPRLAWPSKFARHLRRAFDDPYDETHFSPAWLVRQRGKEVVNAWRNLRSPLLEVPKLPASRPFVLLTLHRQPEASVDVLASKFSNQLEVVRAFARSLPADVELYVKEHSNGLGDRSPRELAAYAAVPGVRLIHPHADSFTLIDAALAVVSLSGTASYEAALMGKRAACVAPMFFGELLVKDELDPFTDGLAPLLSEDAVLPDEGAIVRFLARVRASSFAGRLSNPRFDPASLEPDNLDRVARGFVAQLER